MPTFKMTFSPGLLILAVLYLAPSAWAEQTITCESRNFRYQYCHAETHGHAQLDHQISKTHCQQGRNWDYDRHGVWVDQGCAARFRVGYGNSRYNYDYDRYDDRYDDDDDNDHDKKVLAGAALAGIAIAAIAASKHNGDSDVVPSWAVGSFTGYDPQEQASVDVRILPGGSVSGTAGRHSFSGTMDGETLQMGNYTFDVTHSGNGFQAVDRKNSSHRLYFSRSGSGY